jgi:hypothetical protein
VTARGIAAALGGVLLAGCSIGASEFSCPGQPGKPLCLPASEVYRLTNGAGPAPARMESTGRALDEPDNDEGPQP